MIRARAGFAGGWSLRITRQLVAPADHPVSIRRTRLFEKVAVNLAGFNWRADAHGVGMFGFP